MFKRTSVFNLANGLSATGLTAALTAATHVPDFVGNIRIDQAWGLWQISAALHVIMRRIIHSRQASLADFSYRTTCRNSAVTRRQVGRCGDGALQIKNIPWGAGDDIKMDASFAKGMTKQVIATDSSFAQLRDVRRHAAVSGLPYQSIGFGATTDAVYLPVFDWRHWRSEADDCLWFPWCLQPQLGSILVVEPVRQLCPLSVMAATI